MEVANTVRSLECEQTRDIEHKTRSHEGMKPPAPIDRGPGAIPDVLCLYSVVGLHAITVPFEPRRMRPQICAMVAALLGAGVDPQRSVPFKQLDARVHAELAWLLGCVTAIGWLNCVTQYKQMPQVTRMESGLGLLAYLELMVADILVFRATHVPEGSDRQQHLELARMVPATTTQRPLRARAGTVRGLPKPFFAVERTREADELSRITSLREPIKKMSKSDHLTDSADEIRKKIMKATTDAVDGIAAVTSRSVDALTAEYATAQTSAFKRSVADGVIARVGPMGERVQLFAADPTYIDQVQATGVAQASEIAEATTKDVKAAMGM
ncbi:hypothetical protein PybrP1_002986 [[Pythium] brassicae (nom. inval.)]|nr:hypothetical protein PybrP1_002986 [[Pythium] brassicae (nom. inval.)]